MTNPMNGLITLLLAVVPQPGVLGEACDRISVNHVFTDEHKYVFSQVLFADWSFEAGSFQIRDWRMMKPHPPEVTPDAALMRLIINEIQQDQPIGNAPDDTLFEGRPKTSQLRLPPAYPTYDHARAQWVSEWFDGEIHRRIVAPVFVETHTSFDAELTERAEWPVSARQLLRKPFVTLNRGER
jgi:hypothetical protein